MVPIIEHPDQQLMGMVCHLMETEIEAHRRTFTSMVKEHRKMVQEVLRTRSHNFSNVHQSGSKQSLNDCYSHPQSQYAPQYSNRNPFGCETVPQPLLKHQSSVNSH